MNEIFADNAKLQAVGLIMQQLFGKRNKRNLKALNISRKEYVLKDFSNTLKICSEILNKQRDREKERDFMVLRQVDKYYLIDFGSK